MISHLQEEEIRRIVRDEIAQDEMRHNEQERAAARSRMVPGNPLPPGTICMGYDPGCEDSTVVALRCAISGSTLFYVGSDPLGALDEGQGA